MDGACGGALRWGARVDSRMPAGRGDAQRGTAGNVARSTRANVPAPTGEG